MSEPGHGARHAMPSVGGLGICCSPARIAPSHALNLPLQTKQVLICFPVAPIQYDSDSLGSTVEPAGASLAQSTSSGPLFTLFALPTSRLYLAPTSAPHNCIQPYLGSVEPRDLAASSRLFPRENTDPPHRHATLLSFCLSLYSSTRFAEQLFSWQSQTLLPMSQNVPGTWMADVTAPLANSPPKSRLALAAEPPDQPPRYPPPDRIHPQGPHTKCREPPLRFRLHIRP